MQRLDSDGDAISPAQSGSASVVLSLVVTTMMSPIFAKTSANANDFESALRAAIWLS